MSNVPSNLIPTRITQLPDAPIASEDSLMLIVYGGVSYKIRVGDLLSVSGVPTSRQVIAGTGLSGGGALSSNVTLSIAAGGVGATQLSTTGVTAGTYGSASLIPVMTVDATGRVTSAVNVTPSISNLAGGAAFRIAYQTAPNATGFIPAPSASNTVLEWDGTSFVWVPAAVGTISAVTASLPISSSGGTTPNLSIPVATGSVDGYLSSSDWSTFNNKQSGITLTTVGTSGPATFVGNVLNVPNYNPGAAIVTSVTATSPVVSSGGSTPNISLPAATGSVNGYLTSADWTTFNNKVTSVSGSSGRITSTGGTTPVIDLVSGIATAGTTGSSTLIPVVTVDTYGRVTSVTTAANPQGTVTSVATSGSVNGITLTGGTITSTGTITLGGTLSGVDLTTQVTGTLPVGNGGTGATTLTGYVKGNGTSAFTASSTVPNTDITGLGTMSTQNTSSVAITGGSINGTIIGAGTPAAGTFTNVTLTTGTISTAPTAGNDIVNKSYADSISTGVNYHPAVQYATAATLTSTGGAYTYNNGTGGVGATLTGAVNAALVVDGHTMVAGDVTAGTRVLIKNETGAYVNTTTPSAAFNGVYVVTQIATVSLPWVLTRATDYDTSGSGTNEIDQGDFFYVVNGTANTNTSWIQQTALPITVGTTQLSFVQFGAATVYTAGTGLTLSGSNQFSITNTGVTANTYGSASSVPVLTVNAQGQLSSVTNTSIALAGSAITSGSVAATVGGTGQTSYTLGDLLYASSTSALSKLADVATGNALISGGVGVAPSYGKIGLTTHISGTLPVANGGTNATATPTAGAVAYGSGTAYAFTAAGTAGQVLISAGAGTPVWGSVDAGTF